MSNTASKTSVKELFFQMRTGLSYQHPLVLRVLGLLAVIALSLISGWFVTSQLQQQQVQEQRVIKHLSDWMAQAQSNSPSVLELTQLSTLLAAEVSLHQIRIQRDDESLGFPSLVNMAESVRTQLVTVTYPYQDQVLEIDYFVSSGLWLLLQALMWSVLGFVLIAIPVIWWIMQAFAPVSANINEMTHAFKKIRQGLIASRLRILGRDELSRVCQDFNAILDTMQAKEQVVNRSKEALVEAEAQINQILSITGEAIWDWDLINNKATHNANWLKILGLTSHQESHHRQVFIDMIHEEDVEHFFDVVQEAMDKDTTYSCEYRVRRADGQVIWLLDRGRVIKRDLKGLPMRMMGSFIDITQRQRLEQDLLISAVAFETQDGMLISDADFTIIKVNPAFCNLSGFDHDALDGVMLKTLFAAQHTDDFYQTWVDKIKAEGSWQGEMWFKKANQVEFPVWLRITPVSRDDRKIETYVIAVSDISERMASQQKIEHLAFYDNLTNLPNRRLLLDRIEQVMAMTKRSHKHSALMFVDLDNFKVLNDTQGHDVGDLLLKTVADRLRELVRQEDTVSRLGGDEFVVLYNNLSDNETEANHEAQRLADKLLQKLNKDYPLTKSAYRITPSIGVTLFSGDKTSVDELLKQADIAMYETKASGRNGVRFFDPAMQAKVNLKAELERDIRKGIELEEFEIFYQSQVDHRGYVFGAEALIRWNHPRRGLLMPGQFMETVEQSEMIYDVGAWIVETACKQLNEWRSNPLYDQLKLSINVSSRQFGHEFFVDQIRSVIAESGADATKLKIELTETVLIQDVDHVIDKMTDLKRLGVDFVLDDFGTGYSSLAYLKKLPIDQLKIDRSFVRDILIDPNDAAIAQSVIGLSQTLGLSVLAEGVEYIEQRDKLLEMGCNLYQGYYFSKPVGLEEFEWLVKKANQTFIKPIL